MRLFLIAAMLMLPTAVFAGDQPVPTADDITIMPAEAMASPQDWCFPGNEWFGNVGGNTDNYTGEESYAMLIDPASCPTCDLGFNLSTAYITLQLEANSQQQISLALADAVDMGGGCFYPGSEQAVYSEQAVPSNGFAGSWTWSVPWNPGCLDPSTPYFLIFNFADVGTGVIGPEFDDDGVTPCRAYHNDGSGWTDLASTDIGGDIFIWADANCCSDPVGTEAESWGSVKSIFR